MVVAVVEDGYILEAHPEQEELVAVEMEPVQ